MAKTPAPSRPGTTAEEVREATRAAHEAIQELRDERRALARDRLDLKEVEDRLEQIRREAIKVLTEMKDEFGDVVTMVMKVQLSELRGAFDDAARRAEDKVYKRFADLSDVLLGTDLPSQEMGLPPLLEMIKRWIDVMPDKERRNIAALTLRKVLRTDGDDAAYLAELKVLLDRIKRETQGLGSEGPGGE